LKRRSTGFAVRAVLVAAMLFGAASTGLALSSHNTSSPKPPPVTTPPKPAANPPAPNPVPRGKRPQPKLGHLPPQRLLPKVGAPGDITNPGFETGDLTGWTIGANCVPYEGALYPQAVQSYQGVQSSNVFTPPSGAYFATITPVG